MKILPLFAFIMLAGLWGCQAQNTTKGYQDIDVAAFKQKMQEQNTVLLDVRTPEEIAQGKIEGAAELDFRSPDFEAEVDKLDKNKTYLIYCRSGNRSGQTCKMMAEKGFTSLYNLDGGILAWKETGN
jgi:rhodanese-related sulfurtransferase